MLKEKPHNCFHSKSSKVQGRGGIFDLWLVECWQMIVRAGETRGLRGQLSPATDLDGYWSKTFFFTRPSSMRTNLLNWCNLVSISKNIVFYIELVSKELNHSSRFVLFCSFWRLFTIKMIENVKVFPFSFWKIITKNFHFYFIKFKPPA